jgi:hypothetical protein
MMPPVGKSGAGMISISSSIGIGLSAVQAAVDHFGEVVRRNVGGHAHGDARGAVDQQVRQAGRQTGALAPAVVVGPKSTVSLSMSASSSCAILARRISV